MGRPRKDPIGQLAEPHKERSNSTLTLTYEIIDQVEKLYRIGLRDNSICNMLGISPNLMREWLVKGATYQRGIHFELFKRCAKAVASCELELFADIRNHALGRPAEYAYDEIVFPDGSKQRTIAKDKEGKPIIAKAEVKANPMWAAWILEKRFKKMFGKQEELTITTSTVDDGFVNATLNNVDNNKGTIFDLKEMTNIEQEKILNAALRAVKGKPSAES